MIRRLISHLKQEMIKNKWIQRNKCKFSRKAMLNKKTKCGKYVFLGAGNYFDSSIGDFSYVDSGTFKNVSIGKYTSISTNVQVIAYSHPLSFVSTSPAFLNENKCLMRGKVGKLKYCEELITNNGFFVK